VEVEGGVAAFCNSIGLIRFAICNRKGLWVLDFTFAGLGLNFLLILHIREDEDGNFVEVSCYLFYKSIYSFQSIHFRFITIQIKMLNELQASNPEMVDHSGLS
jgi:hypothetical protein